MLEVLIADDHRLLRQGLRGLIDGLDGLRVVAEAADGAAALEAARCTRVDVALIDIAMPGLDGLETIERLRDVSPRTRAVVLTVYGGEEYVLRALEVGARGFLLKGAGPVELEIALRAAGRGGTFLCPGIAGRVVTEYLRRRENEADATPLTARQREVLRLVAGGHSSKVIAERLGVSQSTVNGHRDAVMRRLGVAGTGELVRVAARAGLLPPER